PSEEEDALPDEPVVTNAWERIAAKVRYRADSVDVANVPLSNLAIDFSLEEGAFRFAPVGFGAGQGSVDFTLARDVTGPAPQGVLGLEVRNVDLRDAFSEWDAAGDSLGVIAGLGKFWVEGASVADLLASADGGAVLLMSEGKLDPLIVELAELDFGGATL